MTEAHPAERHPFWDYLDLLIFILLAFPLQVVGALFSQSVFAAIGWYPPWKAAQLLSAQFLGFGLLLLSLYALLKMRYRRPFWRSLGWVSPGLGVILRCYITGPLLAIAIGLGGLLLRTPDIEMPIKDLLTDPVSIALIGVFATTLGPVFEELAFRGFLLPLLVRSIGPVPGVILTALPFAVLHGPQYAWSWRHLLLLTVASSVFGIVRLYIGSTAAAAALHSSYNLTFFAVYLLQDKDF